MVLSAITAKSRNAFPLIASPRSASKFLGAQISSACKLRISSPKTENGFGHFSVDQSKFPRFAPFLWYQHLFPTPANVEIVKRRAAVPPILLWRNPFDWIVSMADWCVKRGRSPWGIQQDKMLLPDPLQFTDENKEAVLQYVIDFELPLYLRFLNGWMSVHSSKLKLVILSYSFVTNNTEGCLQMLADEGWPLQEKVVAGDIAAYVDKGIAGRGLSQLSFSQIAQVTNLVSKTSLVWTLSEDE